MVRVGDAYQPVRWTVMDASELEPTLDLAENQYRDRNRVAAQQQVREIAANIDFQQLGASPLMDYGAPLLARDGRVIAERGPGEVFGEIALLSEGPRTATVTTTSSSTTRPSRRSSRGSMISSPSGMRACVKPLSRAYSSAARRS